jgi:hypothetical protein
MNLGVLVTPGTMETRPETVSFHTVLVELTAESTSSVLYQREVFSYVDWILEVRDDTEVDDHEHQCSRF